MKPISGKTGDLGLDPGEVAGKVVGEAAIKPELAKEAAAPVTAASFGMDTGEDLVMAIQAEYGDKAADFYNNPGNPLPEANEAMTRTLKGGALFQQDPTAPGEPGTIDPKTQLDVDLGEEGYFDAQTFMESSVQAAKATGGAVKAATLGAGRLLDASVRLRTTPSGAQLIQNLDDAEVDANTLSGQYAGAAIEAAKGLTRKDRKWLNSINKFGYTNAERMIDFERLEPPNPRIAAMLDAYRKMYRATGMEAERIGVPRVLPDGTIAPFTQSKQLRFLRHLTPDAQVAVTYTAGEVYEALARTILEQNPNIVTSLADAKDRLQQWRGRKALVSKRISTKPSQGVASSWRVARTSSSSSA